MGNGGCGQFITRCRCHSFLLTLCPCSSMGAPPRDTVLHELLQRGSLPRGAVLQEQPAPAWIPHGVTSPASKPAPAWAPLSTGPQVLPGACSSVGSPRGHSLLQASPGSGMGSSPGCGWGSAPPWTSLGCRGTACLTMVCSTGCRGTSALAPGAPPPPPLHRPWCLQSCCSHIVSLLSQAAVFYCTAVFSLLNCVIPEPLPPLLMGLALASSGSTLELAGIGSIRHGGRSFWQLLTGATSVACPVPKPCHANPVQLYKPRSDWRTLKF